MISAVSLCDFIYFTAIGMFSMPTEEELREQMAELTESKGA